MLCHRSRRGRPSIEHGADRADRIDLTDLRLIRADSRAAHFRPCRSFRSARAAWRRRRLARGGRRVAIGAHLQPGTSEGRLAGDAKFGIGLARAGEEG